MPVYLRALAITLAIGLIVGELWRSWGVGRPFMLVFDDVLMGLLLIAGAAMASSDTLQRRALFAGAWGVNAGMLYGSFFAKLAFPEQTVAGNWNANILTFLLGLAFLISVYGFIATIIRQSR